MFTRIAYVIACLIVLFIGGNGVGSAQEISGGVHAAMTCEEAPEAVIEAGGSCGQPSAVGLSEQDAERVSFCTDGLPVFVDPVTGAVYGDQDHDGVLAGDDCAWS
ncbi:hypothetical protein [Rhodococcus opacus]|uniref:hypothetical protein n=1 Tax=Rhodococcus opacus TaxID=37919 RepID=UPI0029492D47|nr:hypothetical protein [Rhodococcus opacus]MDV6246877.1 hypothetical protein [Rhodococcus opacus]